MRREWIRGCPGMGGHERIEKSIHILFPESAGGREHREENVEAVFGHDQASIQNATGAVAGQNIQRWKVAGNAAGLADDGGFGTRQHSVAGHIKRTVDGVTHASHGRIVQPCHRIGDIGVGAGDQHVHRFGAAGFVKCRNLQIFVFAGKVHFKAVARAFESFATECPRMRPRSLAPSLKETSSPGEHRCAYTSKTLPPLLRRPVRKNTSASLCKKCTSDVIWRGEGICRRKARGAMGSKFPKRDNDCSTAIG